MTVLENFYLNNSKHVDGVVQSYRIVRWYFGLKKVEDYILMKEYGL